MNPSLAAVIEQRERVLLRLRDALIQQLRIDREPDEIDPDAPLFGSGLGLDSLDAVEILVCLEAEFGVRFPAGGASPSEMRTLNSLVDLVLASGGAQ